MTPKELAEIQERLEIGETGGDLTGVLLARALCDIRLLLAEVRRLTPTTRWTGRALRAGNASAAYYLHLEGTWRACTDIQKKPEVTADFPTEPEARAHIEAWAKSKGYEVRDE